MKNTRLLPTFKDFIHEPVGGKEHEKTARYVLWHSCDRVAQLIKHLEVVFVRVVEIEWDVIDTLLYDLYVYLVILDDVRILKLVVELKL